MSYLRRRVISADARLLGVCNMAVALPAGAGGDGARAELDAAQELLSKAIEKLDCAGAPPELAARVQEALDAVTEHRAGPA